MTFIAHATGNTSAAAPLLQRGENVMHLCFMLKMALTFALLGQHQQCAQSQDNSRAGSRAAELDPCISLAAARLHMK